MSEPEHEDEELAQAFRRGLRGRAEVVDTTAPLVAAARGQVRRRRRDRLLVALTGLATAAVLVTLVVTQADDRRLPGRDPDRVAQDPQATSEPTPTEWRTETWHGLDVDVPADWGWGVAPTSTSLDIDSQYLCGGPGALVDSDGRPRVNPLETEPWVGRPVMASDLCIKSAFPDAKVPYVWLGAAIEAGTIDAGNGFVQETVAVLGTTLTVATDDPVLRQRILDSARATADCDAALSSAPTVEGMLTEGLRDPSSAQVCAYRRGTGASSWDLVYATTLDADRATAYYAQVYDGGSEVSPQFCGDGGDEVVLVTVTGDDPYGSTEVSQPTVVDPVCREVQGSPGTVSPLSDAGMRAWSSNGSQAALNAFNGWVG